MQLILDTMERIYSSCEMQINKEEKRTTALGSIQSARNKKQLQEIEIKNECTQWKRYV